jgi:type IV pilus assembly protein PilN
MLVEINLLPKKEHKKSSQLMIALFIVMILAVSTSVIYIQGNSYEGKLASVDKQIETVQNLNTAQQEKMTDAQTANSTAKLEAAVQWAEQYPLETVPLLRNVISLLPDRGFIQNFEYSNTNSVIIKIQFDASRDAAYYLSSLKQAEWVQEVDLMNVVAETKEEGTEATNASAATSSSEDEEQKTLPRYSAEYEITFKPDQFKEKSEVASKGGDET